MFQKLKSSRAWLGQWGRCWAGWAVLAPWFRAHLPGEAAPLPHWTLDLRPLWRSHPFPGLGREQEAGSLQAPLVSKCHSFPGAPFSKWSKGHTVSSMTYRWLTPFFSTAGLFLLCGSCNILSSHTFFPLKKSFYFLPWNFIPGSFLPSFHLLLSSHPFSNEVKDSHLVTGDL